MYVEVVAAVGDAPKATKQAAVAVTITVCISAANADVWVAPLEVVALNVWVVLCGLKMLLRSIISFTLYVGRGYFEILIVGIIDVGG